MADLVIKNCKLVLPDKIIDAGIAIENEKIVKLGKDTSLPNAEEVIDAKGNYILPGLIDVHVHFREPGDSSKEDWTTGSSAAVAGGVTTVMDMPNTQPPTTTVALLEEKRKIAAKKSTVDYGFHFGATTNNIEEIKRVQGIKAVKFYMGSTTGSLMVSNDAILFEELKILGEKGLIAMAHAENREMIQYWTEKLKKAGRDDPISYAESRPVICATEATNRVIYLSKKAKNKLHLCHVSTKGEIELIRRYRKEQPLTAEVVPHHLFLTEEDFKSLGSLVKTNPPLRSRDDQRALWTGIQNGIIDTIGTDHAPHTKESKEKSIWEASAGVPGLETLLPLLLNEVNKKNLTLNKIVELTSKNPARIFGIKNKGRIEIGYDADLTIIDLKKEQRVRDEDLFTKCGWSPFNGWKLKGWPVATILRGNVVFKEGEIERIKGREILLH